MSTTWDPALYLTFDDHRSRPFHDLVARIGARDPRRVVDLGCGPGHLTSLLAQRWPGAEIAALDSSAEMVAAARDRGIAADQVDAAEWMPGPVDDVVVTNAVLQWVPEHRELLPRWLAALPAGAWFAMQVPGNFGAPSHVLLRELAAEPQWAGAVRLRGTETVSEPADYADLLAAGGAAVDVWETTYLQRLTGPDPVLTLDGRHCAPTRARRPGRHGRRVRRVHCRAGTAVARGVPAAAGREHVVPVPADLRGRADHEQPAPQCRRRLGHHGRAGQGREHAGPVLPVVDLESQQRVHASTLTTIGLPLRTNRRAKTQTDPTVPRPPARATR